MLHILLGHVCLDLLAFESALFRSCSYKLHPLWPCCWLQTL